MKDPCWKQLGRMFLSGIVATLIAILSARRFESWTIGAIAGIVAALTTCDVKKTLEIVDRSFDRVAGTIVALVAAVASLLLVLYIGVQSVATCTYSIGLGMLGNYVWSIAAFLVVAGFSGYQMHVILDDVSRYKGPTMPILRMFLSGMDKLNEVFKPGSMPEFTRTDAAGRICSVSGLFESFLWTMKVALRPIFWWAQSLVIPIIVIIDVALTVLLFLATARSISVAMGAMIGLAIDCLYGPAHLSGAEGWRWLALCCSIGAVAGYGLWRLKLALSSEKTAPQYAIVRA